MDKYEFQKRMGIELDDVNLTEMEKCWLSNFIYQEIIWNMLEKIGVVGTEKIVGWTEFLGIWRKKFPHWTEEDQNLIANAYQDITECGLKLTKAE